MAVVASPSVNSGLIGAGRGTELGGAVTDVEGGETVGPHHTTRSGGAPTAAKRWAARLEPASRSREGALLVAEGRAALRPGLGRGRA